jgi:hypothetical protein
VLLATDIGVEILESAVGVLRLLVGSWITHWKKANTKTCPLKSSSDVM